MARSSQFIQTLTSVMSRDRVILPPEDVILMQQAEESLSERFFYRNFSRCSFPANLYDRTGTRQIAGLFTDADELFPKTIRMPKHSASGCAYVVAQGSLYFLYDRIDRWDDAPEHLSLIAVHLDHRRILALCGAGNEAGLTKSEYLLLAHLLTGLDLKAAAAAVGASYDTKRKQAQIIMEKLGVNTQAALLRTLSVEITARILDEILPTQGRNFETALVKRQFGRDVIVNTVTIGEGIEIPVWEFGARRGRPVLYFHSMLAPVLVDTQMVATLKRLGLRWIVVPRHFLGFDGSLDAQARLERVTRALAETMEYLTDQPLICIGESAGVPWAAHFARHHPDLIARLVLVATPQAVLPMTPEQTPTIFVEMTQRLRADARVIAGLTKVYNAISRVPDWAQKGLAHLFRNSPADTASIEAMFQSPFLAEWLALIANHATLASVDEITNMQRNWLNDLREAHCDIAFIHGAEDPISPVNDIRAVASTVQASSFTRFDDAGHLILIQHFEALMKTLIAPGAVVDDPARAVVTR
ncbi:alpha/beta fold hydrolase [Albirhodobacter sp. R86504]|uniref:alpha/beta fold hydrolase n=1 Tax=Albirhodobacter sp. R86504 TaxID=3093848 RepID=UPI003670E7CD